ncbi:hypothetical protein AB4Z17_28755 [Paenibacillus sp. TAF43_2]|uniref:hypothetical protein n=1 Tax=Paenibacillus sp. TAF43_2 TaxID=3233069 RepID=UPI003F9B2495
MALLLIMFIVIAFVCLISIALLYMVKDPPKNTIVFLFTAALGIFISFLNVTSFPSNLVMPRIIAVCFGMLAIIGVVLKYKHSNTAAKLFITASVVLGIVQLFFL